jgi:hypothetical protein
MINPKVLLAEFVATLSSIPDLVAALSASGGLGNVAPWTDGPIQSYSDGPGTDSNLREAILQMPPGSILVAWAGTKPRRLYGAALLFQHQFCIFLRAPEDSASYEDIFNLIITGVPTLNNPSNLPMLHLEVDVRCYPMDLDMPTCSRNTIVVSADGATFDYFEIQTSLTETGAV